MAYVRADRGPDVVRKTSIKVSFKAFAVGVVNVPVNNPHIGRNLNLVTPEHDTTVGATVTVVAEENVAVDCKNMGSMAGRLVSLDATQNERDG